MSPRPEPLILATALLGAACSSGDSSPADGVGPGPDACTFSNPIGPGQDPWIVRHDGAYHLVESRDGGIWVYRSEELTAPKRDPVRVWQAPATGWNRTNIWAPELHLIDGRWYIYYAAGEAGPPYIHQRSGVLQSAGSDPRGPYEDLGMLRTVDDLADHDVVWAIDLTVERIADQLYAVWSGWEENRDTDRTPQHLYIAEMSDPWTISSGRVRISSPVEPWERGTALDLNEGPQFLRRGDDLFIIYSTRESWLPDYRLGQLRLASPDADPMDPDSWIKTGPVFTRTETVYGPGHNGFAKSPDGTEDWLVYHAKVDTEPGWNRVIRMQPFGWNADGSPDFGEPVPSGVPLPVPSGQPCDG
jgi:GH43 family beta-xylosidase